MARITPPPAELPFAPVPFPAWARAKDSTDQEVDAAFLAGAGLAALDAVVRADAVWSGVWRQRLALTAAVASIGRIGRAGDEPALRDVWALRRPGDDPGPAGHVLGAWRRQVQRSSGIDRALIADSAASFGLRMEAQIGAVLEAAQECGASHRPAVIAAAEMVERVVALRPDALLLGLWLADRVLAMRLRWSIPIPLLANGLARRAHPGAAGWLQASCLAYARGAAVAIDLAGVLARRAEALQATAPKLRAKGAAAVITALLDEDAVAPSSSFSQISDRGLRRLFDRLVELGAVRELTGRTSFRLYGL